MNETSMGIDPPIPELPTFQLPSEEVEQKRTYSLTLNVKKSATTYRKIVHLDNNTDLNLIIKFIK